MEDPEQKTKSTRKSRIKKVAGGAEKLPGFDTLSAPTKRQAEATGVKIEKRSGEPKGSRSQKQKKGESRAEASAQAPGVDSDTEKTAPVTSHPSVGEPLQEALMTPQRVEPSTVTPMVPPVKVPGEAVESKEKAREGLSIRDHIVQRLLKGFFWMVQICAAAILSILLGFNQPASDIPILDFIERNKLTVLVVLCIVVILTLVVLLALRALNKQLWPRDARLKAMGAVTSVSILSSMLCLSLLGITLDRPSWCPSWLCPAPQVLLARGGVHDSNLQVTFQTLQSSIKVIPGDPSSYTLGNLPIGNDAQLINTSQVLPYRVVLKIHSLQQGPLGLVIEQVAIVVTRQAQVIPYPLHVWIANNVSTYTNNLYRVTYRGQATSAVLSAPYVALPLGHVSLLPGETDELSLEVRSTVVAELHFQVQVTYLVLGESVSHTLTLPNVFEVIFSDPSNWHPYRLQDGQLVPTS